MAVAALGASVLLALVGPKSADAAFPGKNGKIVYTSLDSSFHSQIYTVPAGGGKPTKVTKDAADHYAPAFSPNGKTIVYYASDGSNEQIYTVPAGGGKRTKVTTDATDHEDPTFSPDGKTIAYEAWNGMHWQIYTIPFPSSGETPTPLTNEANSHYNPDFSPDGNTIVYHASDSSNEFQLYTIPSVPPSGGGTATPTQLTNDATPHKDPAFSPNGTKIVYENDFGGLFTIPFPSSGATPTPVAGKKGGDSPNWGVSTRR